LVLVLFSLFEFLVGVPEPEMGLPVPIGASTAAPEVEDVGVLPRRMLLVLCEEAMPTLPPTLPLLFIIMLPSDDE